VKDEHRHLMGLLRPHTIPESKWEVISMEFIGEISVDGQGGTTRFS
jgi:hypothetical protein